MDTSSFDCFDLERTIQQIADVVSANVSQVRSAVDLLDDSNTIPFISRYRKEATGGMDEIGLRTVEDEMAKARELAKRKTTILQTIAGQDKLSADLRRQIENCSDKKQLEALYLPFKPKRRTKATLARERGLGPLADILLRQENLHRDVDDLLSQYVNAEQDVRDREAALQGACDIVAEQWSEDAKARSWLADQAATYGRVSSQVKRGKKEQAAKYAEYLDRQESVGKIPSHRFLAMRRGEAEGLLGVGLQLDDEYVLRKLKRQLVHNPRFEFHRDLLKTVDDCYRRLLLPATESAILQELKDKADVEAISVFAKNLRELLLAPPAGPQITMGLDPGFRTGCKVAVVDGTGKFLAHQTIYPTPPRNDVAGASETLLELVARFDVKLIAIGNGTASRETDTFVSDLLRSHQLDLTKVVVSEAGASVYSASETAAREYPDLDVTVRGAISIAHRLQDPLAELVKIDPKSIGVGQYQHDVNQTLLRKSLEREIESCVNSVGIDVNLASAPLLSHVAGIGPKLAERVIEYRDANGRFKQRDQLCRVPKLGAKAYQQAAGFLRIPGGTQPLDNSAVHPESYYVVTKMAAQLNVKPEQLIGNQNLAVKLQPADFVDDQVGLPSVVDILAELSKPGRDPRREFRVAQFTQGVNALEDLKEGMTLEGVVTNVARFGAFVDVGVHQDGLIHISQLANTFVEDPSDVVFVGDVVRVKVLEIDLDRRRIALSRKAVT